MVPRWRSWSSLLLPRAAPDVYTSSVVHAPPVSSSDWALSCWFVSGHLSGVCDILRCSYSLLFPFILSLFLFCCSTHTEIIPGSSKKCSTKVNANLSTKTFGQKFWVSPSTISDWRTSWRSKDLVTRSVIWPTLLLGPDFSWLYPMESMIIHALDQR